MLIAYAFTNNADGNYEQYFKKQLITKGQINNGLKNGDWSFYYPNQALHFEGSFTDDKKQGNWTFRNEKGEITTKTQFKDGLVDSAIIYYKNNVKEAEELYKNGASLNICNHYYPNGSLKAQVVKDAKKTTYHAFHLNTKPCFTTVDWLNKKTDTTKVFFSNGQLKEELSFYKNVLLAVGNTFNPEGNPIKNGNFKDGKGTVIRYFDNLQPKSVANYDGGRKNGIAQFYYENGQVKAAGMFAKGKKVGVWKYYSETGELSETKEHRSEVADKEFVTEFSPYGLSITKTETVALFPGGDRALNKLLKSKIQDIDSLKGLKGIFLFKLDEFGFITEVDLRSTEIEEIRKLEIEKSIVDLPRCIPAFENGLPVAASITHPFKF